MSQNIIIRGEATSLNELEKVMEVMTKRSTNVKNAYGNLDYPCLNRTFKIATGNLASACLILAGKALSHARQPSGQLAAGLETEALLDLFKNMYNGYHKLTGYDREGGGSVSFDDFDKVTDNSLSETPETFESRLREIDAAADRLVRKSEQRYRQGAQLVRDTVKELTGSIDLQIKKSLQRPELTDEQVKAQMESLRRMLLKGTGLTEDEVSELLVSECGESQVEQRNFLVETTVRQNLVGNACASGMLCDACEALTRSYRTATAN